jgi:SNF2 domain-containing protein/helicase-like protein
MCGSVKTPMPATATDEIFKAIRQACSAGLWSQAVELVRAAAVAGVSENEDEIVCRVRTPNRVIAPKVTLFPLDEEWDCDCDSKLPCCEHVAAAIIAVRRAHQEGGSLPTDARSGAHLAYRFKTVREQLLLERFLVKPDGQAELLDKSVAGIASSASDVRRLTPTQSDIAIDRLMGLRLHGGLGGESLQGVLLALADARDVQLDGEPVSVEPAPLKPVARVVDDGKGFKVILERDPRLTAVVVPGVARGGDRLYVLGETELSGATLDRLPSERKYGPRDISALVTDVLPSLMKRVSVDVRTTRLPKLTRSVRPSIALEVEQVGNTLSVFATLVYGTHARIDGGHLVHLEGDVPLRDEEAEKRVVRRLKEQLDLAPGNRVIVNGAPAAALAERLDQYQGDIRGRAPAGFIERRPLEAKVGFDGGSLSIDFEVQGAAPGGGAGRHASAEAVLSAWQNGLGLVPLVEGGWAPLPADWLERHGRRVAELLQAKQAKQANDPLPAYALPALAQLCGDLGVEPPGDLKRLAPLIQGFEAIPVAPLPGDLRAELRDYQRRGVDWLCFLRDVGLGATLADDMGLGKTLQTLCAVRGRTLVIAPRSVLFNWKNEAARFRPGLRCEVYHGPKRALDPDADITITTYSVLRIDQELLAAQRWGTVVLDEAQTIKNPDSQVTRAAYRLPAEFRVTLSGTPVENRLEELWSQFHFTNPGLLGGRQYFQDQYATPISDGRPDAAKALRTKIRPFLLRRLKSDVARELPPRTDLMLECDLNEEERAVYDAIRAATQKDVVERLRAGGSVLQALEALLRLRQAACHSALIPGQQAASSSKVEELLSALEEATAEGHKSLVFSQWTSFLDLIEPHLEKAGIAKLRLDGSTRDRQKVVDQFQARSGPPVLLMSLKAGGTGLNLTAADHVFLMDLWWNPAVEDQAADRAHRIGQEHPVFVYRLVAKDTVEERILDLQQRKRGIADAALGDADQAGGLSRADLLTLLE